MKKWILFVSVVLLQGVVNHAMANFSFGTPTNLGLLINSPSSDLWQCISADGLSLYFASTRSPGGYQNFDLWMATRSTSDEDWGTPVHLGDVLNSWENEWSPCLSADGLELYYAKGPWGDTDLCVSRRNSLLEPWGIPENLGSTINSPVWDNGPSLTADGLELYFDSTRDSGSPDLYVCTRATVSEAWGPAMNLGPIVNSPDGNALYGDQAPSVSPDGLTLFFSSARSPGSASNMDIWMTKRATRKDAWGTPVRLDEPINSNYGDMAASFSADGSMLYFTSARPGGPGGGSDFWQAPIVPTIDFNGDAWIDIEDLVVLIDHWGQDVSDFDMGPMPWGDGVVDVNDLEVLMSYWGQEVSDPTLQACWKLDEAEGDIAYDSAAEQDAILIGDALWFPEGGQIEGALKLNGTNGYVSTPFVLNPADGPFSVLAWIKGGKPGQSIISQEGGEDWLDTDPSAGQFSTRLSPPPGRFLTPPLVSNTVITDGNWHHVGLVWDGVNRILYVDDIEGACDLIGHPESAGGGLYIGAGSDLEPGTFWSGLIDDVRIYDRAVQP